MCPWLVELCPDQPDELAAIVGKVREHGFQVRVTYVAGDDFSRNVAVTSGHGQIAILIELALAWLSRGAKAVQGPSVLAFVMTQHVEIAVVGAHPKIGALRGIPAAINFLHFELSPAQDEIQRPLISTLPRIAFDV